LILVSDLPSMFVWVIIFYTMRKCWLFDRTGILTLVAWIFFAGITTVISRYYKPICGTKELLGAKFWFQVKPSIKIKICIFSSLISISCKKIR